MCLQMCILKFVKCFWLKHIKTLEAWVLILNVPLKVHLQKSSMDKEDLQN